MSIKYICHKYRFIEIFLLSGINMGLSINISSRQPILYKQMPENEVPSMVILAIRCRPNRLQQHCLYCLHNHSLHYSRQVLVSQTHELALSNVRSITASSLLQCSRHKGHSSLTLWFKGKVQKQAQNHFSEVKLLESSVKLGEEK